VQQTVQASRSIGCRAGGVRMEGLRDE